MATTYRNKDGRYVVKLPFKSEFPNTVYLESSRFVARRQYIHMETKLQKNEVLSKTYGEVLKECVSLGHMKRTGSEEICEDGKYFSYYYPIMLSLGQRVHRQRLGLYLMGQGKRKAPFR